MFFIKLLILCLICMIMSGRKINEEFGMFPQPINNVDIREKRLILK